MSSSSLVQSETHEAMCARRAAEERADREAKQAKALAKVRSDTAVEAYLDRCARMNDTVQWGSDGLPAHTGDHARMLALNSPEARANPAVQEYVRLARKHGHEMEWGADGLPAHGGIHAAALRQVEAEAVASAGANA